MNSNTLLQDYVKTGSETAFRHLVEQYIAFVYSVALRYVQGDRSFAQDITQAVFTELAKKAHKLPHNLMLGGWLHRHTCFVATSMTRAERRRRKYEKQAVEMNALDYETDENWKRLAPHLDDAMNRLRDKDRMLITLRFFERFDYRSIGESLGITDDTAQKRVSRAVEKLRASLLRRGITISTTTLLAALTGQIIFEAPAGVAATISAAALVSAAAKTGAINLAVVKFMTSITMKTALAALAIGGVATTFVWQHQIKNKLRAENLRLQEQIEQVRIAVQPSNNQTPLIDQEELRRLREDHAEVLRLRGQISRLRNATREALVKAGKPAVTPKTESLPSHNMNGQIDEVFPPGTVNFTGGAVMQVLEIYKEMTGRELILSPEVVNNPKLINIKPDKAMKRSEVVKLIEDTLREQAALEFKPMDDQRYTVSYSPALIRK